MRPTVRRRPLLPSPLLVLSSPARRPRRRRAHRDHRRQGLPGLRSAHRSRDRGHRQRHDRRRSERTSRSPRTPSAWTRRQVGDARTGQCRDIARAWSRSMPSIPPTTRPPKASAAWPRPCASGRRSIRRPNCGRPPGRTGVTTAIVLPSGGFIGGQAAIVETYQGPVAEMVRKAPVGVTLDLGAREAAEAGSRPELFLRLRELLETARLTGRARCRSTVRSSGPRGRSAPTSARSSPSSRARSPCSCMQNARRTSRRCSRSRGSCRSASCSTARPRAGRWPPTWPRPKRPWSSAGWRTCQSDFDELGRDARERRAAAPCRRPGRRHVTRRKHVQGCDPTARRATRSRTDCPWDAALACRHADAGGGVRRRRDARVPPAGPRRQCRRVGR